MVVDLSCGECHRVPGPTPGSAGCDFSMLHVATRGLWLRVKEGGGQPLSLEHPMGWSACSWPRWTDQGSLHQCLCRFADRWHLGQNLPLGLMMPQAVLLWTLSSSMLLLECSVPPCCLGKGLILPVPMWDRPKPLWLHILARGHAEFSIWLFQGFQWTT